MGYQMLLNFEKISMEIIEAEIAQMTDDNLLTEEDFGIEIIDEGKFRDNLYHGSIAAIFIVNLYESALNTIISRRLHCTEIEILKTSHNVKLQLICTMYHTDFASIKGDNAYSLLQSIIKVRNDITHYKCNNLGRGFDLKSATPITMGSSKESLGKIFTKEFMKKHYDGVLALLELICNKCGLVLNTDCEVVDCTGRDDLCEFIVTKELYEHIMQLKKELATV